MIWFSIQQHSTRAGLTLVEIWRGDAAEDADFVGTIYPEVEGIRFVSAYEGGTQANVERKVFGTRQGPPLRVVNIEIGEKRL